MHRIVVPHYTPTSRNKERREHWSDRAGIVKKLMLIIRPQIKLQKVPVYAKIKLRFGFYFRTAAVRDQDNYSPKALIDALKHCEIMQDDDWLHCRHEIIAIERDATNPRTEIFIEEGGW